MKDPRVLLTLRCPHRCYLGSVVATDTGPVLVLRRRELVQTTPGAASGQQVDVGPYPLDQGLETVDVGCRHLTEPLFGHGDRIRAAVNDVRHGSATRHDMTISLNDASA